MPKSYLLDLFVLTEKLSHFPDTQTKRLPGLFDEEDEQEEEKKSKPAIRYTVEDAKEEIEMMKLRRKRKTERILNEGGENRELLHSKKKKKKKGKEKKKEKKRDLLLAGMVEAEETIVKVADRAGVAAAVRAEGTDLRAELSRRRAQRLQGQVRFAFSYNVRSIDLCSEP